jgi:hypothetical protein
MRRTGIEWEGEEEVEREKDGGRKGLGGGEAWSGRE